MAKRKKAKDGLSWLERKILKIIINKLIKKIENMQGSWKTSLLGWLTLLAAVTAFGIAILDGDPTTQPDFEAILAALAGVGLIMARDKNVSSEQQREAGTDVK